MNKGIAVIKLLNELDECGATIVMVTPSVRDSEDSHRVINLFDGHVVTENIKEQIRV